MRPGAAIVSILTLLLTLYVVIQLSSGTVDVTVTDAVATHSDPVDPEFTFHPEGSPQPKAEFESTVYDFGEMQQGQKGTTKFVVWNRGDAPLQLKAGSSTCQCTVGSPEDGSIAPGESTTVELSWEIRNMTTTFEHSAHILTNELDVEARNVKLVVKGLVVIPLQMMPQGIWNIGYLSENMNTTMKAHLFSTAHEEFEITKTECAHKGLTFKIKRVLNDELANIGGRMRAMMPTGDPQEQGQPDGNPLKCAYEIEVSAVAKEFRFGRFSVPVKLTTTVPEMPEVSVEVSGSRYGPFQIFPAVGTSYYAKKNLIEGRRFSAKEGKKIGLTIMPRNSDLKFKAKKIEVEPSWLSVSLEPESNENSKAARYKLIIEVPPGKPPVIVRGPNIGRVFIETDHPQLKELEFELVFSSE